MVTEGVVYCWKLIIQDLTLLPYSRYNLDELIELFDIKDIIDVPVRKLSMGQRMKCELAAALLHSPKVLFLDEPTIGLDIISQ